MTTAQLLIMLISMLASIVAAAAAWAAFVRAGRWRDTDDGKVVQRDIHTIKNELTKIEVRLGSAEKSTDKMSEMHGRMTAFETKLESVASSGDIRELKAELGGVRQIGSNTQAAVQRIENWLVEQGSGV